MTGEKSTPGYRPGWVDDDLFPFESRFLTVGGNVVHYVDEGRGPVLLMLHGNPTWSFVYRQVISKLSSSFRCIALDYPGFGLSTARSSYGFHPSDHAEVVSEFIVRLDLDEVTLVGQDWGGPIGLTAALHHPDKFSSLVLGNTWAWPLNGDLHFEIFSRLMGGPIGRLSIRHLNLFVNVMIPAGHRRRKLSTAEMIHYRQALPTPQRRTSSAVFPKDLTAARAFLGELERGLESIAELPTLLIWGDADIAFRLKELNRWQCMMRQSQTVILHGAGHFLQSDAPDDFADAVAQWRPRLT